MPPNPSILRIRRRTPRYMLRGYFGFTREPFSKELDPTEYFPHNGFQELHARLTIMVETRA